MYGGSALQVLLNSPLKECSVLLLPWLEECTCKQDEVRPTELLEIKAEVGSKAQSADPAFRPAGVDVGLECASL